MPTAVCNDCIASIAVCKTAPDAEAVWLRCPERREVKPGVRNTNSATSHINLNLSSVVHGGGIFYEKHQECTYTYTYKPDPSHIFFYSTNLALLYFLSLKGTNPASKKPSNIPEIYAKMFGRFH